MTRSMQVSMHSSASYSIEPAESAAKPTQNSTSSTVPEKYVYV